MKCPSLITLLDTSIANTNLGNQIIMKSIECELKKIFPLDFLVKLQYGERFGELSLNYIRESSYSFFGGTNSLSSEMNKYSQMGLRLRNTNKVSRLILLGLGWWQYQKPPNMYTKIFLKRLLCSSAMHSVRDQYTLQMLKSIGVTNVVNTSCPTTWNLTKNHCLAIPASKANCVITTVTDYNLDPVSDTEMINLLIKKYDKVYIWLQGLGDFEYLKMLGFAASAEVTLIPPSLSAFENILETVDLDYIGTRLHAGIKAIQHSKRALIVAVDNRAAEISRDINVNICTRGDVNSIKAFIEGNVDTRINIPSHSIREWKNQFIDKMSPK